MEECDNHMAVCISLVVKAARDVCCQPASTRDDFGEQYLGSFGSTIKACKSS